VPPESGAGGTGATTVMVLNQELSEKRLRLTSLQQKRERGLNNELLQEKIHKQLAPCRPQKISLVVDGVSTNESLNAQLVPVLTVGGMPRIVKEVQLGSGSGLGLVASDSEGGRLSHSP